MDSAIARIAIILFAFALIAGGVFLFLHIKGSAPCPTIEEVIIVSSSLFSESASDTRKSVPYGESVVLAAVVKAKDRESGEIFYVSPVKDIVVNGEKIPRDKIKKWPYGCGELIFLWFSVEEEKIGGGYKDRFRMDWGFEPTHYADVRAKKLVDADPDAPNIGAMFFKVRAECRNAETKVLLQFAATPGAEYLNAGGDEKLVHRVLIGEE